ncbi:MAG: DoxX family protein [Streptosporangiales bacterium]|nr:DoxX family protein [Streptosporangiales bacterium]
MNNALWARQGILVAVFLFSSIVKGTQSKERIIKLGQTGVVFLPMPLIRFTALAELAGALGLALPWLTDIAPVLTPIAAAALGLIMPLAAVTHIKLREPRNVLTNIVILALCVFVAWGRFSGLAQ